MAENRWDERSIGEAANYDAGSGDRFDTGSSVAPSAPTPEELAAGRYYRVDDLDNLPVDPTVANWTLTTTATNDVGVNDHSTYIGGHAKSHVKLLIVFDEPTLVSSFTISLYVEAGGLGSYYWDTDHFELLGLGPGIPAGFSHAWIDIFDNPPDVTTKYIQFCVEDMVQFDEDFDCRIGDARTS